MLIKYIETHTIKRF